MKEWVTKQITGGILSSVYEIENMFIGIGGHVKWMIFVEQFEATQQAFCKSLKCI